jgi:hypothetical protein
MKIRRLSEIDLARFCAIPEGEQLRQALRNYNAGGSAWSYEPVRSSTAELLNASTTLFGSSPRVAWPLLERQVRRACTRGIEQTEANVEAAAILYHFAEALDWQAVKFPMGRLAVGMGEAVRYWADLVLDDGDGPFIPFFDHRRQNGVSNGDIRRIVFSLQDVHVRQQFPDLAEARLAIVRLPCAGSLRSLSLEFHESGELLSYDELNTKVSHVYREWASVLAERDHDRRGTGTSGGGGTPLGL